MTKTARDIALAILALEEVVTTLRALSDDLNEPDTEPEPVWPTAPYVWWGGKVWAQSTSETYFGGGNFWGKYHLNSEITAAREGARRFAREAVPVMPVPTEAWEKWKSWVPSEAVEACAGDRELINAVDSLAQDEAHVVMREEALNNE